METSSIVLLSSLTGLVIIACFIVFLLSCIYCRRTSMSREPIPSNTPIFIGKTHRIPSNDTLHRVFIENKPYIDIYHMEGSHYIPLYRLRGYAPPISLYNAIVVNCVLYSVKTHKGIELDSKHMQYVQTITASDKYALLKVTVHGYSRGPLSVGSTENMCFLSMDTGIYSIINPYDNDLPKAKFVSSDVIMIERNIYRVSDNSMTHILTVDDSYDIHNTFEYLISKNGQIEEKIERLRSGLSLPCANTNTMLYIPKVYYDIDILTIV